MIASLPDGVSRITWYQRLGLCLATALRLPGTHCQHCRKPDPFTCTFPGGRTARLCLPCLERAEAGR